MPKFKLPPRLPFRKLGLAGLGLIGGSITKAFMPFGGLEISVFDGDPETVREAKRIKRLARVTSDPEEFLSWPLDLAYLCLPVQRNVEMVQRMGRLNVPYPVTDSGSAKGPITEAALAAGLNFCGGHPIAGKEVAGFKHSSGDLIRGCLFLLTPDPRFGPRQKELLGRLKNFHELLGCRIRLVSPAEHDRVYALISHLPYVTASALAGTALRRGGPDILSWAGTGFRDTTRVGASPPLKWVEVAMENSANLTDCLDSLIEVLTSLKEAIAQKNEPELTKLLEEFSAFRRALPPK
ncbi:MAG: prephenate dehydrogenase/arogenate dehydrogenase family protein [Deltaproteobacteria bacterium]|nr:prephenate dehydrogenase/arogenate dehydrogenase family protein [Deltaproteobacteria bacterium]